MKTLTYTSAIVLAVASTGVFAHHPIADINPETYERVTEQLEAVDSPHLDMDMDAMGATTTAGASDMSTEAREQAGWVSNQAGVEIPEVDPMDAAESADTMVLME